MATKFHLLEADKITETAELLAKRIKERFPESGLSDVVNKIVLESKTAETEAKKLAKPNYWIRSMLMLIFALFIATAFGFFGDIFAEIKNSKIETNTIQDILQIIESGINNLAFIVIAVWSLITIEDKWKRSQAIRSLHSLRSLAHIVDMHQLTKDPEVVISSNYQTTASSPKRTMTAFQLTRYLDYCAEALALISKIAALHVQYFEDAETLAAVSDVENLTDGLSRKIWQKISILDRFLIEEDQQKQIISQ